MTASRDADAPKKTTDRSLSVAETVMDLDGATLAEVAEELDLAKSTAYSHLRTLRERGYLVKEGEHYHVGLQFLHLGGYAASRKPYYRLIREKVRTLAQSTDERAQFIVEEHGRGIYLYSDARSPTAVQTDVRLGKWVSLHSTSAGKAIMANLPRDRVEAIVDRHGLPAETDNTITDRERLFETLERVRERGYAYNRSERLEKQWAVGVPVLGERGEVVGGLSVSGPEHRMKGDRFETEIPNLLLGVANEIELTIAYS